MKKMPEYSRSYWLESVASTNFEAVKEDIHTDAIIIGGGISGITTAYLLAQQGIKVTVLEANRISSGTTGHTTAKLTAQHSLIYGYLIDKVGEEKAKLYYQANQEAVEKVQQLVEQHQIDCNFTQEDAYIYAESETEKRNIEKEYEAYQKLGIKSRHEETIPLDLETEGAVVMPDQAQFHPVKYLQHLVTEITNKGGQVFENTRAVNMQKGTQPIVETESGHKVTGDYVVVCSHFPFYDKEGFYFARMNPNRSYSLAAKVSKNYPGGMYINAGEPAHSLRSMTINNEPLVLIGGHGHSAGHHKNTTENYQALYKFGDQTFGMEEVLYRWSAQDPIPLDKVPYIGTYSREDDNIFVATGYRKWGMSSGTLAGILIRDLILKKENPYQDVFSPQRPDITHNIKGFTKMNKHNTKMFVEEKFNKPDKSFSELKNDEGAVVETGGKRTGAYKDKTGNVHLVDTTCTHMGCELRWNNGERSWDCPCHGSRFTYKGQVIEGPATVPLKVIDPDGR